MLHAAPSPYSGRRTLSPSRWPPLALPPHAAPLPKPTLLPLLKPHRLLMLHASQPSHAALSCHRLPAGVNSVVISAITSVVLRRNFPYIHGLAAHGVHYLHQPEPTLQDLGYIVLPELGKERFYISETAFSVIFFSFFLWSFHPFVYKSKRFYTALLWCRVFAFLVASQFLRIITFLSTQLPGPSYHCREGSKDAKLPPPETIIEVLLINFPHGVIYGCGDLIFSSHMIFTLVFVRTYHKYGSNRFIKLLAWLMAISQSLLIIASHKHYTVDVVVAWYTVNLVIFFIDRKLPEMPDRTSSLLLLPMSTKDKDEAREENDKLVNASSGETADRRKESK